MKIMTMNEHGCYLFRGKRKSDHKWIEGYLYRISEKLDPFIMLKNSKGESYEVDPETVGPFTGKTLNGKNIFVGDIIRSHEDHDDICGFTVHDTFSSVVIWDKEHFCFAFKTNDYIQAFDDWEWSGSEKIGNIHDDPDLIEE